MAVGNSAYPSSDVNAMGAISFICCKNTDARNGGYVTNFNLSKETITKDREQAEELFLR